ncbi:MAG: GNAT family N-acetyltransferase [Lachnospiraceae bacterium]|nr:GNAT family N-acetyltransferase [Lachnospiraceae bacterium]
MENLSLIELDESYLPQMAELYKEAFGGEPWNDDWSDTNQLNEYMKDISKAHHALNYGLMIDGKLAGLSVGKINHWWEGTNYNIEELCVSPSYQGQGIGSEFLALIEQSVREKGLAGIFLQTDSDKPSYHFYHKNGFRDLDEHISLYKSVKKKDENFKQSTAGSSDEVIYDIADLHDIPELVRLRILYMIDDFGAVTGEEREGMEKQLPGYFERELGKKLIAFVARAEGRLVAAAYLLIIEKPANPFFLNGLDSEVLSVYTEEGYRGKGICTNLMKHMIDYAAAHKISRIDLMATEEGYPIYKKLGFADKVQNYKDMRLVLSTSESNETSK